MDEVKTTGRRMAIGTGVAAFVVVLFAGLCGNVPVGSRYREVCRICRAERDVRTFFGSRKILESDNEFAAWYRTSFHLHEHDWRHSGCGTRFNIFSQGCAVLCTIIDPLKEISPEEERRFLMRATLEERTEFFRLLRSKDSMEAMQAVPLVKGSIGGGR
jgi:hypothetical protein